MEDSHNITQYRYLEHYIREFTDISIRLQSEQIGANEMPDCVKYIIND